MTMKPFDAWAAELADKLRAKEQAATPTVDPLAEATLFQCETCFDTGWVHTMVCYGGPPRPRKIYCPDCHPLGGRPFGD